MSRVDSSFGIRNYTQVITGTSATPLLAPTSAGVCSGFPSPLFPLSTSTYPVGLFVGIPSDVSNGSFDGHPFEVVLSACVSGTATTTVLVNLFNATKASWADGPYAGTYTIGNLGTGCTNVVTGTATAGITATTSINFWMRAQFIWSSANKTLGFSNAAQYLNGSVVSIPTTASVSNISSFDLNFIPQFTFGSGTNTVTINEFVLNRL